MGEEGWVGGWMGEGKRERGEKREWERRGGSVGVRRENGRGWVGGWVGVWMGEGKRERGEKREWERRGGWGGGGVGG